MHSSGDISWQDILNKRLPLLGHRNWIVVADAAYPWQTAPGVETLSTEGNQIDILRTVLNAVEVAPHVRPIIYTDAELPFLREEDAPGIGAYRDELRTILGGRPVESLPHEEIIKLLDQAGRAFHVLLLKTTLTLPYTSVFLQLDCGYWNTGAEQRLRRDFQPKPSPT
jgi:hypothetical protein